MILELAKKEPNDYSFGYKVRRMIEDHRSNKKIEKESIFKEVPKP